MISEALSKISEQVPKAIWRDAERMENEGAVLDVQPNPKGADACVANDQGTFERVKVSVKRDNVSLQCSCHPGRTACSHGVATLIALMHRFPAQFCAPLRTPEAPPAADTAVAAKKAASRRTRRPAVRASLSDLITQCGRNGSVELRMTGAAQSLESRWQQIRIRGTVRFGRRGYSLSNIRKLVDYGNAAGGMALRDFPPQHQQVMRYLVNHAENNGAEFRMSAPAAAQFFHCLTGFHTIWWEDRRARIRPQPARLRFELRERDDQCEVLPRVLVPGHGLLERRELTCLLGRNGAWVGVAGQFWWLPGVVDISWLRLFLRGKPVCLQTDDVRALQALCETGLDADFLPADETAEVQTVREICHPVLLLDWNADGISARLDFQYGNERFLQGEGGTRWHEGRLLVRDEQAEAQALERLRKLGFREGESKPERLTLTRPRDIWTFLDTVDEFDSPWHVYWSPRFARCREATGDLQLSVNTTRESGSWFELECDSCSVAGSTLPWEDVVSACLRGETFLQDPNGGLVRIPDEIRHVISLLLQRSVSAGESGMRFDLAAALPLAEELKPYVRGGGNWTALRRRLGNAKTNADPVTLPGRIDQHLRDYQREGEAWLAALEESGFHGILADEMGLGKTLQALALISRRVLLENVEKPSLVVCPTSLIENWILEAARFAPELATVAIHGMDRELSMKRINDVDLVVTSYALLRRDILRYTDYDFDYIILDEAQHIKNPRTANARTCKALTSDHRLILTGTPLENSLREIWSLFDFLLPGMLGSEKEFKDIYETSETEKGTSGGALLASHVAPFVLRRTKASVCDQLPPKIQQVVRCELGAGQRQLHESFAAAGREMVKTARKEGWQQHRFELFSVLLRLRQLCCHPDLLPSEFQDRAEGRVESAKTELLQELLMEAIDGGHRILLFSQFTSFLGLFKKWLDANGLAYEYMDGTTKDRQKRVDRFNNDESIPLFLLSLKAGGTGLNLTGADTVIHYDQWWNPMVEDQATDRTHRIGQERPVTVYKIVAHDSVEEKILHLQERKRDLFNQFMNGVPGRLGDIRPEDFEYLFGQETNSC